MTTGDNDLTSIGTYTKLVNLIDVSEQQLIGTYVADSSTAGAATITVTVAEDPNDPNSFLHITKLDMTSPTNRIIFSPTSSQRYYTLMQSTNLLSNNWTSVSDQENIQYETNGTDS